MSEPVDALMSAMEAQAQAEKDTVLSDAQAKAREISDQANAEIEALTEAAQRECDSAVRSETERVLSDVRSYRLDQIRSIRHALAQEAFQSAREELLELCQTEAYREVLTKLVREAVDAIGVDAQFSVSAPDVDACSKAAAELGVTQPARSAGDQPGVLSATSPDERRQVDNGLLTRLAKIEAVVTHEVAAVLFGGAPAPEAECSTTTT